MGGACSLCQQTSKFNPIVEEGLLKSKSNHSVKNENDSISANLNTANVSMSVSNKITPIKPISIGSELTFNFSETDYSHYLNLQKILLFKNLSNIRQLNYDELVYEGQLDENYKRHGKGTLKWPNGTIYLGDWLNNKANGKGMLSFSNFEHYEGMFVDNKFEGEGVYIDNRGTRLEGLWINNNPIGLGYEIFVEGHIFKGNYIDGKKNGKGNITFSDGSYFSGIIRYFLKISPIKCFLRGI